MTNERQCWTCRSWNANAECERLEPVVDSEGVSLLHRRKLGEGRKFYTAESFGCVLHTPKRATVADVRSWYHSQGEPLDGVLGLETGKPMREGK
jgi:hypothetical protein